MSPRNPGLSHGSSNRNHAEALTEQIEQITADSTDVPPQIRVGDEPVPEQFQAPTGPGAVLPTDGLWTTTLRRHGPLWHLHLPKITDQQRWWRVIPRSDARIARIDRPADLDSLIPPTVDDPHTVPWGELAEIVDAVWLTERGYGRLDEQLRSLKDSSRPSPITRTQKERYMAFERWASGCVLWLNWCFETVELYRHERAEALFSSPFTLSR